MTDSSDDAPVEADVDLAFPYRDLWYIKLIPGEKNPIESWGGYSQDFADAENVYTHDQVLESDHDRWGIVGYRQDRVDAQLLIFDIDIYKAPDKFDEDHVTVDSHGMPLVRSQSGGIHVYAAVREVDGSESDFDTTTYIPFDIDIRGNFVKHHVVAPTEIPGVDTGYELVNDSRITVMEPQDAAERVRYDPAPGNDDVDDTALLEYDPDSGIRGDWSADWADDPPEDMPTCYARGLQLRAKNPSDHPNTHKVNTLTALCGLSAGYSPDQVIEHMCEDYLPGPDLDQEKTEYHVRHMAEKDHLNPPAISTLRDWGILDDGETCDCDLPGHGGALPTSVLADVGTDDDTDAEQGDDGDGSSWGQIRALFASDQAGTTTQAKHLAAQQLLDENQLVTIEDNDLIWRYEPDAGVFRDDGKARLRKRLADALGPTYSRSRVEDILHRIRSETYVDADELGQEENPHLLCVENGVLDLRELRELMEDEDISPIEAARNLTLHDHSPEYRFISRLQVDYDPDAYGDDHDGWDRLTTYIGERVKPRDIRNVQEYIGYCLYGDFRFKKVFLALGPHNSGKSTFLSVIHRLFPDDSVATEPVQDLTNNRFSAANLHGARVNIAGDLGTRELEDLERFKTVTGAEERMRAEIKGKQAYSFKPVAKFLWAANEVPEVANDAADKAFINRWVFAEFPNEVENPDDRVKECLLADETLQVVLLWAIAGHATLFGWDGSARGFSDERTINAKRAIWNKHGDTIDRFIVRCVDLAGGDARVAKVDLYRAYEEFCIAHGKKPENRRTFEDTIETQARVSTSQLTYDSSFCSTNRPRVFSGCELNDRGLIYRDSAAGDLTREAMKDRLAELDEMEGEGQSKDGARGQRRQRARDTATDDDADGDDEQGARRRDRKPKWDSIRADDRQSTR